jgi:sec-independent protein translocase protein TatC
MAIFVLAAVITPSGDPVSLFALSIPMTVLYLISVLIGLLIQRSRRRASLKAHGS